MLIKLIKAPRELGRRLGRKAARKLLEGGKKASEKRQSPIHERIDEFIETLDDVIRTLRAEDNLTVNNFWFHLEILDLLNAITDWSTRLECYIKDDDFLLPHSYVTYKLPDRIDEIINKIESSDSPLQVSNQPELDAKLEDLNFKMQQFEMYLVEWNGNQPHNIQYELMEKLLPFGITYMLENLITTLRKNIAQAPEGNSN